MLKHLMNGGSLLAYALREGENDTGADEKAALRAKLAGNTQVTAKSENETDGEKEKEGEEGDDDGEKDEEDEEGKDEEKDDDEDKEKDDDVKETEEEKTEREAKEKETAKAQRKQDRMQRRIDDAIKAKGIAEAKVAALEAQLAADPDKTLNAEEIKKQAKALADEAIAAKELKDLQDKFDDACDKLQKVALTIDKEFNEKINDIAEQFGPIPSFMIGVLEDFDNGGEVLAFIANDDDLAEKIWDLKTRPAKMTKELVEISNKLAEAKKPKHKKLSKVPDPPEVVNGSRVNTNVITSQDTKPENMNNYIAKRTAQREALRKQRGY